MLAIFEWVIKNPVIINPGETLQAHIYLEGERIAEVSRGEKPADKSIDASGLLAFPGLIDLHVHLRDLGQAGKEDYRTGSMAALAGGFTLCVDMPNSAPPTDSMEHMKLKLEAIEERAMVDIGLWVAPPKDLDELPSMVETYALGVKIFTTEPQALDLIPGILDLSSLGFPTLFHCEDPSLFKKPPAQSVKEYEEERPLEAELSALEFVRHRLIPGCRVHFTHLTSLEAVEKVRSMAQEGWRVTCDATPHHLLLSSEGGFSPEALGKVNPPLRSSRVVERVRRAFKEGMLNFLVSDHAPHAREEKFCPFPQASPGISNLEVFFPLMYRLVKDEGLPLNLLARLLSWNPAKFMGWEGDRGWISPGRLANITLVDPHSPWRIRGEAFHSKANFTPFEGWEVPVKVDKVFIRGVLAYDRGRFQVDLGFGKPVGRGIP